MITIRIWQVRLTSCQESRKQSLYLILEDDDKEKEQKQKKHSQEYRERYHE